MNRIQIVALLAAFASSGASAATDFGIRTLSAGSSVVEAANVPAAGAMFSLAGAAALGSRFGMVTSTRRSAEHNRRVGGVRNSFHLSGRAIDIARRAGVRHYQIEQALRLAGYALIESLDEGDHSHFAFSSGTVARRLPTAKPVQIAQATAFRMVAPPQ
ncbi:MAG: D-Ala-D-Ala carboxypeptidase family metallohydrolase [Sphingomicrobium sp.]